MFSAIAPAVRISGQFLAPVMERASRDAIRLVAASTVIYGGLTAVGIVGAGCYAGGKKLSSIASNTMQRFRKPAPTTPIYTVIEVPDFEYNLS